MFHWIFKKFKRILGIRKEFCLIIEQFDSHVEATYAKVDNHKKKLTIVRRKKIKDFLKIKKPIIFLDRLILALDPRNATTLESVVRLKRSQPQEIITEGELDHIVFRGLWEFLNRYRLWVAKKMGVSDMELTLAHIEIRDVSLGGSRVFNPLGFKGGELELRFRATFVPRPVLDLVARFSPWARDFAVVENHSIVSLSIPEPSDFVVHLAETRTAVFSSLPDERLYCKECLWGANNVTKAVANAFSIDEDVARLVLKKYLSGDVSDKVWRVIDSKIHGEFRILFDMLDSIYNKNKDFVLRPSVHFNLWSAVPRAEYLLQNSRLKLVDFIGWAGREGYSLNVADRKNFSEITNQGTIALLKHPYSDPHYEFLNKLLRRRARWLSK